MRPFLLPMLFGFLSLWISLTSSGLAPLSSPGKSNRKLDLAYSATPSPTSTPLPSATPALRLFPTITPVYETPVPSAPQAQDGSRFQSKLQVFIRAPEELVKEPYVILSGYQTYTSDPRPISISGTTGFESFECASSPCSINFAQSGNITFQAFNDQGVASPENTANVLVTQTSDGYRVSITSVGNFAVFSDACGSLWHKLNEPPPSWAFFPQDPSELNTQKNLYYLAGRLIASGVVNAKDCPGGGTDGYGANACGLEKTQEQAIKWQNQYDFDIWLTALEQHIPPLMLKSLLEIESQFWPTNIRLYLDEIGLGQINQLGIDVLLRTNPTSYQQACESVSIRCNVPYDSLDEPTRALLRGALSRALDSACPNCPYGVDLEKSSQSIGLIARVLYSNCVQSKRLMDSYGFSTNYEDYWKLTMVSYHSGFGCLQAALDKIPKTSDPINWTTVADNLACPGASEYVNRLWALLNGFGRNQKPAESPLRVQWQTPTPLPPLPTPDHFLSSARLIVKVFVDLNEDGIRQDNEAVDNVQVNLDLGGATTIKITQQGIVVFDLTNLRIGTRGKVSLPNLYRSAPIVVPESGDLPIIFIFIKPVLPTRLP